MEKLYKSVPESSDLRVEQAFVADNNLGAAQARVARMRAQIRHGKISLTETQLRNQELEAALNATRRANQRISDELAAAKREILDLERAARTERLAARTRELELHSQALATKPVSAKAGQKDGPAFNRAYAELYTHPLFDAEWYLSHYPEVAKSGLDPLVHYLTEGGLNGYDPGPDFESAYYLGKYEDVRASGDNPLLHYIRTGAAEGRYATSLRTGEEYDPLRVAGDPYDVRPDDAVLPEAARGEAFLARFELLGDTPDFAGAVRALNEEARSAALIAPGDPRPPEASLVIPVYGQLAYTLNCLDSLLRHESRYPFEVVVYDDRSPDEATKRHLPDVEWIRYKRAPVNGGFIASCNAGAALSSGRVYVMLNNDTRVVEGWLDELVGSFNLFPEAGLVGSKLFYPDGSLQEAGGIVWRDGSAWNYGRNDDPNKPEYCHARQADYISGASIAVRAELWDALGGFDGATYERAYYEDTDMAFRVREAGHQVWFQALSRVIHYEGKTSGTDEGTGEKAYQAANRVRFLKRWSSALGGHRENADNPWREAMRGGEKLALLIDATTPTPDKDSGSLDLVNLFEMLRRMGYVSVFAPEDNMLLYGEYTRDLQRHGVQCLYHPYNLPPLPFLEERGPQFDVAILHRLEPTSRWFDTVRNTCPNAKLVFNTVDLHHVRVRREAETTGDSALLAQAEELAELELDLIQRADSTIVVSSMEKALLHEHDPKLNIAHLPLIREIPGRKANFEDRDGLVFLGGFAHAPNLDAVQYFLTEIWPELHDHLPDLKITIAGSKMPQQILNFNCKPGVETVGFVEDLSVLFERARLMVAPLRFGAGAKGKVISSLSYGVPVVGTPTAAEGMDLKNADCMSVVSAREGFITEIERLHEDKAAWETASKSAIAFAEARHSLKAGEAVLKNQLGL